MISKTDLDFFVFKFYLFTLASPGSRQGPGHSDAKKKNITTLDLGSERQIMGVQLSPYCDLFRLKSTVTGPQKD